MPNINAKTHELDVLFCTHASISQIQEFFSRNQDDLVDIFSKMICWSYLLSPDLIAAMESPGVRMICIFLDKKGRMGYADKMYICAAVIMSEWIAAEKRAMFWHVLKNATNPGFYDNLLPEIECARKTFLYHIVPGEKNDFMQRTTIGTKHFEGTEGLLEGIHKDSISVFELNRQVSGQNITLTLLHYLLRSNAIQCFFHLLENFPKQVFECRTAEEWLFTVCHDVAEKTAIPVILWFEKKKPGIIARARDPWGNTLLWHTLAREKVDELQRTLILNGCDANAKNQWGLSWRLVKGNTLKSKEVIKCPEEPKTLSPTRRMNWICFSAIMRQLRKSISFFAKIRKI